MITVVLEGRLGNALFQYAVGRCLAIKNKADLRLDLTYYSDARAHKIAKEIRTFKIRAKLHTPLKAKLKRFINKERTTSLEKDFHENDWGFDPAVLSLPDGSTLRGYYQSEKYFKDIKEQIRSDLQFRRSYIDNKVSALRDEITGSKSVAIHVRRGDYLRSLQHNVCNEAYYHNAADFMRERIHSPRFFLFSDDIDWCKKNMGYLGCTFVETGQIEQQTIVEFQLMRLCRHQIISNSTFSWWAAWLNDNPEKIVIVPNRWFSDEKMNVQALSDTIPEDWVRINF